VFHTLQLGLFSKACQRPSSANAAVAANAQATSAATSTPKIFAIAQTPAKKPPGVSTRQLS